MKIIKILVSFLLCPVTFLSAQHSIFGKIKLDTSKWAPVAYLSLIPDFGQMNTISYDFIVESARVSDDGSFLFESNFLPEKEQLYRIHFSKKGDPPSSLIIGGKDHNHIFLLANNKSEISINFYSGENFINRFSMDGYEPNQGLLYVNSIVNLLDSLDYMGGSVNREFLRKAAFDRLREFADTCSYPLVSLYALYQSNYLNDYHSNPQFYKKYVRKWRSHKGPYFVAFRKELNISNKSFLPTGILISVGFIIVIFLIVYQRKNTKKSPLSKLTIQERKIFNSIKEGKTNKEIADEFAVSLSTVKTHVNNIYSKLGINSRKEILDVE